MSLEQELEQAILEICARAAADHRISLVALRPGADGARALASRLLERHGQTSPGFRQLAQAGRLDLTFESLVLQARFRSLFSRAERVEARARLIDTIAASVNSAAAGRPIGSLQAARATRYGLPAVPALFGGENIRRNDGYAFHSGGGDELQFHIALVGFGREPWFRYGVGFALRRKHAQTGLGVLAPKIARFNEFMRAHPDWFAHLQIQHHRHGEVSSFDPGPLPGHLLHPPAFIFLGVHTPFEELSADRAADLFDLLMPLYEYVEAAAETTKVGTADRGPAREPPVPPERRPGFELTVDRTLRRRVLQATLMAHLGAHHGDAARLTYNGEGPTADIAVHGNHGVTFYGVSTALTVRGCLREVLGRLLEEALRPNAPQPRQLVVVGEAEPDAADDAYLQRLQTQLGLTVQYRRIDLASDRLH